MFSSYENFICKMKIKDNKKSIRIDWINGYYFN
ncbi:hypothetical protein [Buchnera aphidicola]